MNIVILDGYTLNPGDLDWQPLHDLGCLQVYDRTAADQLWRAEVADILFTNKTVLSAETIAGLPSLKYIGVLATGYDVVAIEAARARGIVVTNVPGYGADSVAQMVFAHILHLSNNVAGHAADVAGGGWARSADWCYWLTPQTELRGKTLGIVGYGEIGGAAARIARGFGMEVLIHTRTEPASLPEGMRTAPLDELLAESDFVSLHCPLTEATRELINPQRLARMKDSAVLINCSRGPLVDEAALAAALNEGRIRAACLDVLSEEPVRRDNPLIGAKNCHITPHIAWATTEARARLLAIAVDNLKAYLDGSPKNVVS